MNDFSITTDAVYYKNSVDILLQEIDTLFDTSVGQLFGDPDHATDFERFLWNENISTNAISNYIRQAIYEKCDTFDFVISVTTSAHYGTNSDILLVNIDIENENYTAKRIYKIG